MAFRLRILNKRIIPAPDTLSDMFIEIFVYIALLSLTEIRYTNPYGEMHRFC